MATDPSTAAAPLTGSPTEPVPPAPSGRRPNPRLEQYKRTWFFLRRNTLALIGLGIIVMLVLIALYAITQPIPWNGLPECTASNNQVVKFTETGLPGGTSWSITVNGVTSSTSGNNVTFSLASGPAYKFTVGNVTGYHASPASGTVNVAGAPITEKITFIAGGAVSGSSSGAASPGSSASLPSCSVCTYPVGTPVPGPNCYQTPKNVPGVIAPTVSLHPLTLGALPMGSLALQPDIPYFYNVYNGMLRGTDYSLLISFAIVIVGAFVGLFLGAVSGFFGGAVDETIMRLVDIFLSIPQLLFVIIVIAVVSTTYPGGLFGLSDLDTRVLLLISAFMIVWWPYYARIVRGQVLVVREQKYVEAARASGAGKGRIVMKHIVPNSMYPVFIQMSLDVGAIPILIGTLVFLGFTIWPTPYFPEWGTIAAFGTSDVIGQFLIGCEAGICVIPWWQMVFPGLALFLFAISVNFLSDGLRDALDPRLRR
ncbi:MAG TPA: ABC transporter permease [Thermoplasmata archaeon]|nr:ABC transporter permease [Thermoplasmata archaeon]